MRLHKKIWLWQPTKWLAIQLLINRYISLGFHIDFSRPLLDIHFLWFIIALGYRPEITLKAEAQRESCRGFLIKPVL